MFLKIYEPVRDIQESQWGKAFASAVEHLNSEMVEFFLRNCFDPNSRAVDILPGGSSTPLLVRCADAIRKRGASQFYDGVKIMRQLLKYGTEVDAVDSQDRSALSCLTFMGADAIGIATELLDHDADPLTSFDDRQSPLHSAIEHAQPAMLDLLLKNLADRDALERNWAAIEQLRPCKHLAEWKAYDEEKGSKEVLRSLWDNFLIKKILDKHQSRMACPPPTV